MLQTSKVKQKLKNGEIVIRAFLRSSDPTSAEIMALAGVDLIVIDNEHYPFNPQRMETIIRAAETYGAECMVRVPNTEPARIAQIMDMGAIGVVVPHIESREEALDDILAIPEVDGISIGPSDVSASYGLPGQPDHPVVKAAIEEGQRKIIASGKCLCDLYKNPEQAKKAIRSGVRMFQIGSPLQLLSGGFKELIQGVKARM